MRVAIVGELQASDRRNHIIRGKIFLRISVVKLMRGKFRDYSDLKKLDDGQ